MYNLYLLSACRCVARAGVRPRRVRSHCAVPAEECVPIFGRWSLWSVVSLLPVINSISISRYVSESGAEAVCASLARISRVAGAGLNPLVALPLRVSSL